MAKKNGNNDPGDEGGGGSGDSENPSPSFLKSLIEALSRDRDRSRSSVPELPMIPGSAWSDPPLQRASRNWRSWSTRIRNTLRSYKAIAYIDGTESKPSADEDPVAYANWTANHSMICGFILGTIDVKEMDDFEHISSASTLWTTLTATYDQRGPAAKVDALFLLLSTPFSWDSGSDMTGQYRALLENIAVLYDGGLPSKDDMTLYCLMWNLNNRSTGDEFRHAHTVLASNPATSHADIYNFLLNAERARVRLENSAPNTALAANENKSNNNTNRNVPSSKSRKPRVFCNNCSEAFCIAPGGGMAGKSLQESLLAQGKKPGGKKKSGHTFQLNGKSYFINEDSVVFNAAEGSALISTEEHLASFVADSICEGDLLELANPSIEAVCGVDFASFSSSTIGHEFLLDTGCTVHISPSASDFTRLSPINGRKISGVNGSYVEAQGVGDIQIRVGHNNSILTLRGALFVPDATVRLVSVACLAEDLAGSVLFEGNLATVFNSDRIAVATGSRITGRGLWRLDGTPCPDHALFTTHVPDLATWHRRLGHANNQAIYDMITRGLATGMQADLSVAPSKCDHCILGKQVRSSIPKIRSSPKSSRRLGIISVDLAGPQEVPSANGNLYIMNIVDDYSSYPWTFVLRRKSDSLPILKSWALKAERDSGERIGIIRTDNGELKSGEMDIWCNMNGYRREYTAPYTSAHNGKVERLHLTVMNKMRAMLIQTELPDNRWDELAKTSSYLTARTFTRSTGTTPYELWYGHKPDLSHLREIGARAFTLIMNKTNPKIRSRSVECILIGYSEDSKAYRLYHRPSHRVITSFHVDFIETKDSLTHTLRPGVIIDNPPAPSSVIHDPPAPELKPDTEPRRSPRLAKPSALPSIASEETPKTSRKSAKRQRRRLRLAIWNAAREPKDVDLRDDAIAFTTSDECSINVTAPNDPKTLREALNGPDAHLWRPAIEDELNSLREREVYELVPRSDVPADRKILTGKWVLVTKHDGRRKARLVARGFQQVYGLDYVDTTSPTTRLESLRVLLHLAASKDWDIRQLDIKTAYLYGCLSEEEYQYMEQPKGFLEPGREDHVWLLKKGLYGMKQSGRVWNKTLNDALTGWDFERLGSEPCGYRRLSTEGEVDACVHVDDFLYAPSTPDALNRFLGEISSLWKYADLGEAKFCVGIAFTRDRTKHLVGLSQTALIDKIASTFLSESPIPVHTPMEPDLKLRRPDPSDALTEEETSHLRSLPYRSLVGSMMYVATGSRPDVAYSVSKLAQFLDCYRQPHWDAALRVASYLYTTRDLKLWLGGTSPIHISGFSDSSYTDCPDTRRSSMGYCFSLGSGTISWNSKKQKTVSCSTTEAEYIAVGEATRESLWLRTHLSERGHAPEGVTVIFCDKNGAMGLSKDPIQHARNKHIDVRHHFIREKVADQTVDIWRVNSSDNTADILTKPLARTLFEKHRESLGVR